jgi:hypothetical protein
LFDSIPHLISVAVLFLVPCLGFLFVLRRERTHRREPAPPRAHAALRAVKCVGCDASLAVEGLLYVRDGTLVCGECRRFLDGDRERDLSREELTRLIAAPNRGSRRSSG